MQATDIMTSNVVTVALDTNIKEIAKLLAKHHISAVPVVDSGNHILGIVSEGDLIRRAERSTFKGPKSWWLAIVVSPEKRASEYIKDHGTRAQDVMTRDVITVPEDASLHDIAELLEKHRIKRVPVTRDGKLLGIVSRANLLQGYVAEGTASEVTGTVDDRQIRKQIIENMEETGISTVNFADVVVKDGVVYLWGGVRSKEETAALEVAARNVPGVWRIENHLTVMPEIVRSTLWAE